MIRNMRLEDPKRVLDRGYDLLVEPEMQRVTESARKRWERPNQGGGLGAKNNSVMVRSEPLSVTATTTLNWPRETGASWQRYFQIVTPRIVQAAVRKATKAIVERWSA